MLSSDFEKEIQQQMGELRFTPDDAVWDNVEAALPEKKRKRYVFFLLLCLLLSGGAWYLWDNNFKEAKMLAAGEIRTTRHSSTAVNGDKKAGENATPVLLPEIEKTNTTETTIADKNSNNGNKPVAKKNTETNTGKPNAVVADEDLSATNSKQIISKKEADVLAVNEPVTRATVNNKETVSASHEEIISASGLPLIVPEKKNASPINTATEIQSSQAAVADANNTVAAVANDAHFATIIPDAKQEDGMVKTLATNDTSAAVAKTKNKKPSSKWVFGINISAGTSNNKSNVFGEKALYVYPSNSSSGGVTGNSGAPVAINRSRSLAYAAGLYAEKQLGGHWKFQTGINYAYYSNTQPVGEKVDSLINYNIGDDALKATNFFRSSSNTSSSYRYRNSYHYLQLPLLIKYTLPKLPLYVQAGPSVSWLLQSNALQYNSSRDAYFTDAEVFNKWLLSLNGGMGFNFTKSRKQLFSVGYNFSFSASSTTKTEFGKQHLVSSQFYIQVPLKK